MIITDPSKRPKERLIEVVQEYFFAKGYTYKKSLHQFARNVDNRQEMVSIWYNKTVNLVSVTTSWAVFFSELEKVYATINKENTQKQTTTLWTDLLNYYPLRKPVVTTDFDLYNSAFRYDDASINKGANALIECYETHIEPFFEQYKRLEELERELNSIPLQHHSYIGHWDRRIAIGLILGRRFNNNSFNSLKNSYWEYIDDTIKDEEFNDKMKNCFDRTISFLEQNDINRLIA